jgi:predicted Zn-dependent protease with MMP-like domain
LPTEASGPSSGFTVRFPARRSRVRAFEPAALRTLRTRGGAVKQNLCVPYEVSATEFEELVADALDAIPPSLGAAMENVAVVVEDWPDDPHLLGLYEGVPLTARGPIGYAGVMPDRITIYRGPICARARDADDLAEQVRVTVVHEIGHHFGIDDERLRELGWA